MYRVRHFHNVFSFIFSPHFIFTVFAVGTRNLIFDRNQKCEERVLSEIHLIVERHCLSQVITYFKKFLLRILVFSDPPSSRRHAIHICHHHMDHHAYIRYASRMYLLHTLNIFDGQVHLPDSY